ncbi:MAG TPA: hypothetical protein VNX27_10355 [Chthoniobacterales bacterium]|nr:hypothetical protein [Chthoniobacterales bacterium]
MKFNLPKAAKILLLLVVSFFATHVVCYFVVMRDDLKYFLVFKHALRSGPDYAPSIIVGLTIMSFVVLWVRHPGEDRNSRTAR